MNKMQSAKRYGAAIGSIALNLLISALYKGEYIYTVLQQICCFFVAVMGINFITGMTGQPMMGAAGVLAIGAYTTGILSSYGWNPFWALIPVILISALIGVGLGYPSLRLSGVYLSFTTIAFSEIVRIFATNLTGLTGGATGIKNIPTYRLFGYMFASSKDKLLVYVVLCIILALLADRIIHSQWGRSLLAVRDNIDTVPACGINVTYVKVIAFCLCTVYCGIAGSMYAHMNNYINSLTFTQTMSIKVLSMLVLGGMGSVAGCFVGTVLIVIFPEMLRFLGQYYELVYTIIMMLVIIFLPGGLVNVFGSKKLSRKESWKRLRDIFIGRT